MIKKMNINPEAKRILCFGDSNTWGYMPGSKHNRYSADLRWTGILQGLLGTSYEVIEEGLNSRGITKGDPRPGKEGRSSIEYIIPCLDSHDPLDYIVVFLGTNELKSEFNLSAEGVGENLEMLIRMIIKQPSQFRDIKPQILIVTPPAVSETTEYASKGGKYRGAHEKSIELKKIFKKVAEDTSSLFVDIQDQLSVGEDGVHMLPVGHKKLAEAVRSILVE